MNSLIVLPEEIQDDLATIRGARARYLLDYHDLRVGIKVRGARLGGNLGEIEVLHIDEHEIRLKCCFTQPPPARNQTALVIAVPRPQTVKKILHFAAMAGITDLIFVRAERTDKSYLQSKTLLPENIQEELIKGLEQSCDSLAPRVSVLQHLGELWENAVVQSADLKLVLAPDLETSLAQVQAEQKRTCLALGPELGWTQTEVERFTQAGFLRYALGSRIYRLEFALALALGQLGRY